MSTEDKDAKDIQTLPQIEEQDGSLTVGEAPAPEETNTEEDASLRTAEGDDHEEEGHSEETAEEAEARRERNRKRRQENKQRRQDYVEGLKRELSARDAVINELSTRVASVERQSEGSKMAQIDAAMREAEQYYNHFKQVHQSAINEANGALATDATEKMFAALEKAGNKPEGMIIASGEQHGFYKLENNINLYIGGVYQRKSTFTWSGTSITPGGVIATGVAVEAVWQQPTSIGIPSDGSVSTIKINDEAVTAEKLAAGVAATNLGLSQWAVVEDAGVLYFKYAGANKFKIDSTGNLTVTGNVTAFGTV